MGIECLGTIPEWPAIKQNQNRKPIHVVLLREHLDICVQSKLLKQLGSQVLEENLQKSIFNR